nr:MAG TPA: hypothetical protein [Caudoviricetes sp.]
MASVLTLVVGNWVESEGKYQQVVNLTGLKCGYAGNVPPVISPAAGTQTADFALLDSVEANVENKTLTIIARKIPSANLSIVVTDHQ